MRVLLFGTSGMVGQGVFRECVAAPDVTEILSVVRQSSGSLPPKARELVLAGGAMYDLSPFREALRGVDACFFCLGVSSAGMSEADYTRVTYDLTLGAAKVLHEVSPNATFIYVSGRGTDSTEKGSSMWARVKGKTENDLLALFPNAYMFRPGLIRPLDGIKPKSKAYRVAYAVLRPLMPLIGAIAPASTATTELVGKAMLDVARRGAKSRLIEATEIVAIGKGAA